MRPVLSSTPTNGNRYLSQQLTTVPADEVLAPSMTTGWNEKVTEEVVGATQNIFTTSFLIRSVTFNKVSKFVLETEPGGAQVTSILIQLMQLSIIPKVYCLKMQSLKGAAFMFDPDGKVMTQVAVYFNVPEAAEGKAKSPDPLIAVANFLVPLVWSTQQSANVPSVLSLTRALSWVVGSPLGTVMVRVREQPTSKTPKSQVGQQQGLVLGLAISRLQGKEYEYVEIAYPVTSSIAKMLTASMHSEPINKRLQNKISDPLISIKLHTLRHSKFKIIVTMKIFCSLFQEKF